MRAHHRSTAALALWLLLLPTPARAQEERAELTVQRTWRLAVVGLDADPGLAVPALVRGWERALRRELPGLDVRCDAERYRNHRLPPAEATRDERALVRAGLRLAEEDGLPVADYDVVFVLTPHGDGLFGLSHVQARDRQGRAVRGAFVHSRPFELLYRGVRGALEGRTPPGFQPPAQTLPPAARRWLLALLQALREPLRTLLELPGVREALLMPTLAHELGHFFAPGDLDVRDGYQRPWLAHATGPDDNPAGHDLECCMYKGRDAGFYLGKLLSMRGRWVVFCDPCREKLGCGPRASGVRGRRPARSR